MNIRALKQHPLYPELTPTQQALLLHVATMVDERRICFLPITQLAEEMGAERSYLNKCKTDLIALGYFVPEGKHFKVQVPPEESRDCAYTTQPAVENIENGTNSVPAPTSETPNEGESLEPTPWVNTTQAWVNTTHKLDIPLPTTPPPILTGGAPDGARPSHEGEEANPNPGEEAEVRIEMNPEDLDLMMDSGKWPELVNKSKPVVQDVGESDLTTPPPAVENSGDPRLAAKHVHELIRDGHRISKTPSEIRAWEAREENRLASVNLGFVYCRECQGNHDTRTGKPKSNSSRCIVDIREVVNV